MILLSDEFVAGKLDGDQAATKQLMRVYEISGYPSIIFAEPGGSFISKIGDREPDGYLRQMAQVLVKYSANRLQKELSERPDDVLLLTRVGIMHLAVNEQAKAVDYFNKAAQAAAKAAPKASASSADAPKSDPAATDVAKPTSQGSAGRLAMAYRFLIKGFLEAGRFDTAIPCLQRLAETSKNPREVVLARLHLANCYLQTKQPQKAVTELENLLQTKDINEQEKKTAQEMLAKAKAEAGSGGASAS